MFKNNLPNNDLNQLIIRFMQKSQNSQMQVSIPTGKKNKPTTKEREVLLQVLSIKD